MKKHLILALIVAILAVTLVACNQIEDGDILVLPLPGITIETGDTLNPADLFTVLDAYGKPITVTAEMLDLGSADLTKAGTYTITFSYQGITASTTITVTGSTVCTEHTDANYDGKCDKCGEAMSAPSPCAHTDANYDGKCDKCGENVGTPSTPCTTHTDANADGKCDKCGATISVTPPAIDTIPAANTEGAPFTAKQAVDICGLLAAKGETAISYYFEGIVADNPTTDYCNFYLSSGSAQIKVYGLGDGTNRFGTSREIATLPIKQGDKVLIQANVKAWAEKDGSITPELLNAILVKVNDVTYAPTDDNPPIVNPPVATLPAANTEGAPFTAKQAVDICGLLEAKGETAISYYFEGIVADNPTTDYCNFYLSSGSAQIKVYGLGDGTNRFGTSREIATLPIKQGDKVLIQANVKAWAEKDGSITPELLNAVLVKVNDAEYVEVDPMAPIPATNPNTELLEQIDAFFNNNEWNFFVELTTKLGSDADGWQTTVENYGYLGDDISYSYSDGSETYTDYIRYLPATDAYEYYKTSPSGYIKCNAKDTELNLNYLFFVYPGEIGTHHFNYDAETATFVATNPALTGEYVLDGYDDMYYSDIRFTVKDGKIDTLTAIYHTVYGSTTFDYVYTYVFSGYGEVTFDIDALTLAPDAPDGEDDVPGGTEASNYDIVFTLANGNLVSTGGLDFSSSIKPFGSDASRGVQYTQANGEAILTSQAVTGVTSVTITAFTNQSLGMNIQVLVGGVALTVDGQSTYNFASGSSASDVTFTSDTPLDGVVDIVLTPTASNKSMYIKGCTIVAGGAGGQGTDNIMPTQEYNPATHNNESLQEAMAKDEDSVLGLPDSGSYNALVIPVQFVGETITTAQYELLGKAFNGTSADTGWQSVSSYYTQSSFGALNITFDITPVYQAKYAAAYYEGLETSEVYLSDFILKEVVSELDASIDFSQYDVNNDGYVDAVYLIYSHPVNYEDSESSWWAYVTSFYMENEEDYPVCDDKVFAQYLFAGIDFMDESVAGKWTNDDIIYDGLLINAATYIHETGHLLSLDDYYDYDDAKGANEGLGSADMMDATVGDHNPYSKLMLSWITPTVVTQTGTYTIQSNTEDGVLMLLLNYNGTNFSEYLLVDLYTASGLNAFHAGMTDSYLYEGAAAGVRIFHVSSQIDTHYDGDSYYSFTNYNNSETKYALIRLVEADGERKFVSGGGYAEVDDLWQAGDSLSNAFPTFARYDGKKINFDIVIDSIEDGQATITVTFLADEPTPEA